MKINNKAFILLSLALTPISGECPSIEDIPVKYANDWLCVAWWWGHGNPYSPDACNGTYFCIKTQFFNSDILIYSGVKHYEVDTAAADCDAGDGRYYPMGSYIVMPGCTFYMYMDSYWSGLT